ncbi:MAG: hypothetical protein NC390_03860 [Fusobacterium sp.]|nr:hypothetical protein [Fusobacterium sp.]
MKNSVLSKIMLGTMLATTLALSSAPCVFAKTADNAKIALAGQSDSILLKGDISLTEKEEKVSLSLRDSDVEQVLRMFADIAGLNIVFYDKVSSKITLDIVDEPVNSAFDMVMELSQLTYSVINGNTLVIAKAGNSDISMMKQGITFIPVKYVDAASMADFLNKNIFGMKKPGLAGSDIVITNPVTNELLVFGTDNDVSIAKRVVEKFDKKPTYTTFKVNYTTPKEMATMICDMLLPTTIKNDSIGDSLLPLSTGLKIANGGYITGGASSLELGAGEVACKVTPTSSAGNLTSFDLQNFSISYQEQNGLINMIGGSEEQIAMVSEFIQKFDRKIPQAYIEVSVIELNESGSKNLSNTWRFYSDVFSFNAENGSVGTSLPVWIFGNQLPSTYDASTGEIEWVDRKPGGAARPSKASLQYSINYALRNSKARTVANPRILVTNGEESTIDITQSYVESVDTEMTASGTGSFVTRKYNMADDAGVQLSVTPFISPDGYVTMNIKPEYTVISDQLMETDGNGVQYIAATTTQTRTFDLTNVRLKDGETLAIAGMIMETDTKVVNKIPGLGDIPYLGVLFRSSNTEKTKSEMLVMITPKIIYDDEDL